MHDQKNVEKLQWCPKKNDPTVKACIVYDIKLLLALSI